RCASLSSVAAAWRNSVTSCCVVASNGCCSRGSGAGLLAAMMALVARTASSTSVCMLTSASSISSALRIISATFVKSKISSARLSSSRISSITRRVRSSLQFMSLPFLQIALAVEIIVKLHLPASACIAEADFCHNDLGSIHVPLRDINGHAMIRLVRPMRRAVDVVKPRRTLFLNDLFRRMSDDDHDHVTLLSKAAQIANVTTDILDHQFFFALRVLDLVPRINQQNSDAMPMHRVGRLLQNPIHC